MGRYHSGQFFSPLLCRRYGCPYNATTFDFLKRAKGIGLPVDKLITHEFPLDKINEAHVTNLKMEGLKIAIINK